MGSRISKRVREKAALICGIAASCTSKPGETSFGTLFEVAEALGLSYSSREHLLADSAREFARDAMDARGDFNGGDADADYERSCAEAECLLRTGWSPGKEGR